VPDKSGDDGQPMRWVLRRFHLTATGVVEVNQAAGSLSGESNRLKLEPASSSMK
jgi:hypothetical protein